MPLDSTEDLAFARAMLADPSDADRRLFYADRLEEQGEIEKAALVREAEGWVGWYYLNNVFRMGPVLHENPRYTVMWRGEGRPPPFNIPFRLYDWTTGAICKFHRDGAGPDDPRNWAWLLALAFDRGMAIPFSDFAPAIQESYDAPQLD